MSLRETGLWSDVARMPRDLAATLDASQGFDDVGRLITRREVRRVVATGNGASYYVAQALWLAALAGERTPVEVIAIPGGLVAKGSFRWRTGDLLLAVSSSGEFRDVIEAIEDEHLPGPFALITAKEDSTIARHAGAVALVSVPEQRAVTHTQAFCGAVAAIVDIWARATGDSRLSSAVAQVPDACASAIDATEQWSTEQLETLQTPTAAIAFGTGPAWAAALENALLVKEVARIPCEGVETREGATATMTGLLPEHLALSLPTGEDPLIAEAEDICRRLGATVLRAPGGPLADARLSAITTFPGACALSVELAHRAGWDPDDPSWIETYYLTARSA